MSILKHHKELVGSGDKVIKFSLIFFVAGVILNILFPFLFTVRHSVALDNISSLFVSVGIVMWIWSVVLILKNVPQGKLIAKGPYRLVNHPIYVSVSLLVLPWLGFLLGSLLGLFAGAGMYFGTRKYAPEEDRKLSKAFGEEWKKYSKKVIFPWL